MRACTRLVGLVVAVAALTVATGSAAYESLYPREP